MDGLVLGVLGQQVEEVDGQVELVRVRELAHARAQAEQLLAAHVARAAHERLAHVEHALALQAQAVRAVRAVEQALGVAAHVLDQLLEDDGRLLLRERPHGAWGFAHARWRWLNARHERSEALCQSWCPMAADFLRT